MNRRTVGIIAVVVFGAMMPIRYYLQEQEKKEREQMMYELSLASSKWLQAAGDSMIQAMNRQQMEGLTASMESLDEIGRALDSMAVSMAALDTASLLTDLSDLPDLKERPSSDFDDILGIKKVRAKIAENPTPSLYLDAGIKEEVNDNFDQAKKDYQAALELDPKYGAAMFQLAKLHLELGEVEQAEKLADQCEKYEQSYANGIRKEIKAYRKNNQSNNEPIRQ